MRLHLTLLMASAMLWHSSVYAGNYPNSNATQGFEQPNGTVDLAEGSTIGSDGTAEGGTPVAGTFGGVLRLADKGITNAIGSFKLPDLDTNSVIKTFDLRFNVAMAGPTNAPIGEGWSLNFGHIPSDNGTGEGGFAPLPRGLTIAFDTADDPDDPPSMEIFVGGVSVANFPRTFQFDGVSRGMAIHWDSFGLDLSFDNKVVCTDLALPGFSPSVGDTFAFSARTTLATMTVNLDNLKATTLASPVLNTGGVIISEFVANNSQFEDEFAEKPSWIEIFNGSPDTADLTGWYLTDSKKNLKKWKIQALTLTPYTYQVVFASGKDRQLSTTSFLHTSFSLAKSGGFVALVRPDGTIASSYEYTQQDKNVSFGEQGVARKQGYMFPASPGAVNTAEPAPASFSPDVQFSHPGGFIKGPVTLTLSVPSTPGIEIHYTLDRTEPGPNSPTYSSPLVVTQVMMVRARSFSPAHLPGRVTSRTFVMMDQSLSNYADAGKIFDSNIPLVYLDSFGVGVDGSTGGSHAYRPSYALVIPPDPTTGRASLTNKPDYAGPAGTHVRGESSADFSQKSYALELWDESGADLDAGLLGMPADSDWILYGPWSEKTFMRNKLIFDWMIAARGEDGMAVRSRFVELFFNQSKPANGQVGFGTYRGVYVLMEKLKRGKNRVPLENLNNKTTDPELITGGYILRTDKPDALKNSWTTPGGIGMQSFDPDRLNTNQLNYVKSYLATFEKALGGTSSRDFIKGYQAYCNPDTFIDARWMLEFAKQVDGYVFSTYWSKDRGGRLNAGPIWDFNIALGNASYAGGDVPTGWYQGPNGSLYYPRLHADPEFTLAFWDRYWELRRSIWDTNAIVAKIDQNARVLLDGYAGLVSNRAPATVQNPVARHYRRWPRLGVIDWPNPAKESSIRTYQGELDYMKGWIMTRVKWLDDQSMLVSNKFAFRPPDLSHPGGAISQPMAVEIRPYQRTGGTQIFPAGDIYYTLDNSDPRLAGGAISDSAFRYTGPIAVDSSVTLKARLRSGQLWTPLVVGTYLLDAVPASSSNLVVSELMYGPAPLTPGETNAALVTPQGFEFLELRNIGDRPADLAGVKFTDGLAFDFNYVPAGCRLLQPGESGVLVSDKRAFMIRYPYVEPRKILGQFRGHLDTGGETISLQAADGSVIKEFDYENSDPWPDSGGSGQSIILKTLSASPAEPSVWTLSAKPGGTPGESGLGSDTFSGDPAIDSDGDGIPDLLEFFSGSDAENPGSGVLPSAGIAALNVNGKTDEYLAFQFCRRPGTQGLKMTIEHSSNLGTWVPDPSTLVLAGSQTNRDGTITDTYRGTTPAKSNGPSSSFYRLKVQQQ
jgi:hypothetical protein